MERSGTLGAHLFEMMSPVGAAQVLLCRRLKITPTSAKAALLGDPGKALHAGLSSSRPAERDWCTGESSSYAASINALILPKA